MTAGSPLPMFPLGTVLFPHAMTSLHIFEPRYRALARDCTQGDGEFGIVLIERGHEVGGGDIRCNVGTRARIQEAVELDDGRWLLTAAGVARLRVVSWLPDDPYPMAMVEDLDHDVDAALDDELVAQAERIVRRSLAYKAELNEPAAPMTMELAEALAARALQLAAIAPIGPFDAQGLLTENDPRARLQRLIALVDDENAVLAARLAGG
jgi:Lon protease-like protein